MRKKNFARKLMTCLLSVSMLAGDAVPSYASFADAGTSENVTAEMVFQDEDISGTYVSDGDAAEVGAAQGTEADAAESTEADAAEGTETEAVAVDQKLSGTEADGFGSDVESEPVENLAAEQDETQEAIATQDAAGLQELNAAQETIGSEEPGAAEDTTGQQASGATEEASVVQESNTEQDMTGSQDSATAQDMTNSQDPAAVQDAPAQQNPAAVQDALNPQDPVAEVGGFTDGLESAPADAGDGAVQQGEDGGADGFLSEDGTQDAMYMNFEEALLMTYNEAAEGSLQAQINQAYDSTPTTIYLDKDYTENITIPDNKIITLNLNGHTLSPVREEGVDSTLTAVTVFGNLTVQGDGSITANGVTNIRGIVVANGGSLTLNGGEISGYQIDEGSGAGLLISPNGSLTLTGGIVSGNTAADYGGGIFAYNPQSLTITGGIVSENKAANGGGIGVNNLPEGFTSMGAVTIEGNTASQSGGGLYLGDGNMDFSYEGTVIQNNIAESGNGGGVYYAGAADMGVFGAAITGNTAGTHGGGIYCAGVATAVLEDMKVDENVSGTYGGGIYFQQGSNITINSGSISENKAGASGGGFIVYTNNNTASKVEINGGTIDGNSLTSNEAARRGAGFYVLRANVTINGGSVSGNTRASYGGGIYQNLGTLHLIEGKISNNIAYAITDAQGLGIYTSGDFTMSGGEISGNRCENGNSTGGGVFLATGTTADLSGGKICGNVTSGVGGGIRAWAGCTLTLEGNIVIEENTASDGGGIYNWWNHSTKNETTIKDNATIRNNKASSVGGLRTRTLTMEGGEISGNEVTGSVGGVWCMFASLSEGAITGNKSNGNHGGMCVEGYVTMTGGEISGNTAGQNSGGLTVSGNSNTPEGSVSVISGGKIVNNRAGANYAPSDTGDGWGGGIYISYGNSSTTQRCAIRIEDDAEISGNRANLGGGMHIRCNADATIAGGRISGNTASVDGGGICQERYSSTLTVTGGAVSGNDSSQYGHDICVYNYGAREGNANAYSYYKRPELKLCPADQMAEKGIWHDEVANLAIDKATAIDNSDYNSKLAEDDVTTSRMEGYTFVLGEVSERKTAQIGENFYSSVQEAVNAVVPGTETEILLLKDTVECVTIPTDVSVTLNLQGHTIKGAGGSVITVPEGAALVLRDTSEKKSGKIRGGIGTVIDEQNGYRVGGGLFIEGNVTIEGGSVCENRSNYYGGGIYIRDNGSCVMNGGTIRDNSAFFRGGGVYVTGNGSFTLIDGEISGNNNSALWIYGNNASINIEGGILTENSSSMGGAAYIQSGIMNIRGGTITKNRATNSSGGVYLNAGTLNLSDGVITENTAPGNGGGIGMGSGSMKMTGGTIRGNTGTLGGGIYQTGGNLEITGGAITGNTASNDGGGISYNGNWTFKLEGSGQVYANKANTGSANDIFFSSSCQHLNLMSAAGMGLPEYDCWFNSYDGSEVDTIVEGKTDKYYYLTASKKSDPETHVARINTDYYPSIQEAINAAQANDTIYLLRDCQESVSVNSGKEVILDLNGYTLVPDRKYVFFVTAGGKLHLQNTYTENDRNADNVGIVTAPENAENTRAVYVTNDGTFELGEGVTIQNFGETINGTFNGGAIYAASGGKVDIQDGTIQNCRATNGGGIYVASGGTVPVELHMSGGVIRGCEATSGGGIYFNTNTNNGRPTVEDKLHITGGVIEDCKASSYGGGIRVNGKNQNITCLEEIQISGVVVQNNTAQQGGGAYITTWGRDVDVELGTADAGKRTVFQGNQANEYGALFIYELNGRNIHAKMTNVDIKDNRASARHGGVYIARLAGAEIRGCVFSGNWTTNGGGSRGALNIELYEYREDEPTVIEDTTFENNYSNDVPVAFGRGIFKLNKVTVKDNDTYGPAGISCWGDQGEYNKGHSTTMEITNCDFHNNRSSTSHSAVSLGEYCDVTINGGTKITGNNAVNYGTISCSGVTAILRVSDTEISGNTTSAPNYGGGGIYCDRGQVFIGSGTVIRENTSPRGGGIYVWREGRLTIAEGSQIEANHANYGGGILLSIEINASANIYRIPTLIMEGGEITGNEAKINGGGIYVEGAFVGNSAEMIARNVNNEYSKDTKLIISGGEITGNSAGSYGGGVYTNYNGNLFQLVENGKIYANNAGLGQDVYGNYSSNYVGSDYYKQNELQLMKASDMFAAGSGKTGIGWLDEIKGQVIEEAITGKMIRAYALTLDYTTDDVVALIGSDTYTSIQAAVSAVENGEYPDDPSPEIRIIRDVTESVSIPASVSATLNLNGYKLQGVNTALSVYGNLVIKDAPKDITGADNIAYPAGKEPGTISGNGVDAGGGIRVYSGGYAKLEGGEISGCHAGERENTNANGGAGVCVDSGTFEMAGGAIRGNTSRYGAAVLVRTAAGKFLMTGGTISENNATGAGVVYNRGGSVEITGGTLENNTGVAGTIYNQSGRTVITGTADNVPKIENNTVTSQGGGVYLNNGTVTLGYADILNNCTTNARTTTLENSAGGGVYVNTGTLNITEGTLISSNSAVRGGAIYNRNGSVKIVGGTITKNRAQMGGGIAQHPNVKSTVDLMSGAVYNNTSTLSAAGNDFYSKYEGSGNYNPTGGNSPELSAIPASRMGNSKYNVWKDDTYAGSSRTGMLLLEGEYVTGSITQANNVELTADYYETETETDISSDYRISELHIGKYDEKTDDYKEGMTDGIGSFEANAKEQEVTAEALPENSGAVESAETYTSDNGDKKHYISYNGKLYEQDQVVQWAPGKDSSNSNGVIRSYDTLTYSLSYQVDPKEPIIGDEPKDPETVHVWIEAELPVSADEAEFSVAANSFDEYTVLQKVQDGKSIQVLRGYIKQDVVEVARGNINLSVNIKGMKNGDTFKPVFRSWIEGNEENETNSPEAQSRMLTVSAAGQYNIVLDHNTELSYTGYFNLLTGEETTEEEYKKAKENNEPHIVYGTMLGYGVTVEMFKEGNDRRGFEIPDGNLSFDISMKGSLFADGEAVGEGGLSTAPYLWAYKENENTTYGRPLNGSSNSVNMDWNDEDDKEKTTRYAYNAAPFNTGGNNYSCYNGGSWTVSGTQTTDGQPENTFQVNVSGYTINNDSAPYYASDQVSGRAFNSSSVKPFTAGYLQVIFPVTEEQMKACDGKYMEVHMEAAVSDLEIRTVSGQEPMSTENGLDTLELYFGGEVQDHARNEMRYADNYINFETGMYVSLSPGGPGDNMIKENFFLKEDRSELSGTGGRGTTPLDSVVYIEGKVNFSSMEYDTQDAGDLQHYINPDVFNPQTDNYKEYNYMTAVNLLQKFDADAYTPVGAEAIVDMAPTRTNTGTNSFGNGAFYVATDETATEWSDTKTRDYKLTVLYAAKPDGTNWTKVLRSANSEQDDGGVADMDSHREENLLYFTTLDELYSYFAEMGIEGKCVGILYEFRDCCIRTGRYLSAQARMQVTSDFARTGQTYCTTNDLRAWTTYRPEYKLNFRNNKLSSVLYDFSWTKVSRDVYSGAYGLGLEKDLGFYTQFYDGDTASKNTVSEDNPYKKQYEAGMPVTRTVTGTCPSETEGTDVNYSAERIITRMACQSYYNEYVKSQYSKGNKEEGTHNGNRSGNTLLLYTLDSSIYIRTDDLIRGGSATSFKTVYSIDKGERIVKYEVTPGLTIASAVEDHELVSNGSQAAEVHMVLKLPNGLEYLDKSISFDYSDKECGYEDGELQWTVGEVIENEDGSSSLEVTTVVADINRKLPVMNFSCEIGNPGNNAADLTSGTSLVTTAEIYATYEEHNNIAVDAHTATSTIQVLRTRTDGIYLDTGGDAILKDVGQDFKYVMHYYYGQRETDGKQVNLVNVLPYVGDGRGTDFTGGYRVKEITLQFNDTATFDAFVDENAGIIKYASGKSTQESLTHAFDNTGTSLKYTVADRNTHTVKVELPEEELIQDANTKSGIALYIGFLMKTQYANSTVDIAVTLSPLNKNDGSASDMLKDQNGKTQAGGNVYADDFIFWDNEGSMQSSTIPIRVFNRRITGMVWMDMNHDGKYVAGSSTYRSSDKRLAGIDVSLLVKEGDTWVQAKDTVGALVPPTVTNANGFYSFENLPAGTYRVEFTDEGKNYTENSTIPFENLSVTTFTKDTSSISTSRVVPVYTDNDETTLDEDKEDQLATLKCAALPEDTAYDIVLPGIDDGTAVSEYVTANWNAGFYYIQAEIGKTWKNMRTSVIPGTSVTLRLNGTVNPDGTTGTGDPTGSGGTGSYNANTDYVFIQKGSNEGDVTVTKTSGANPEVLGKANVTSQTSSSGAGGTGGSAVKLTDYHWSVKQALQAEGSSGPVTYTIEETPVPSGYIKSVDTRFETSTGITYFQVTNEQQHSEFGFTKVAYEDYGNTLKGAAFDLYYWNSLDEASDSWLSQSNTESWKLLQTITTGEDGKALFENLPTGYYRLVEKKAPDGRTLPKAQWTIHVAFNTDAEQGTLVPEVTRTRILEESTGSGDAMDFDYAVKTEIEKEENGETVTVTDVRKATAEDENGAYLVLPNKITIPTPTGISVRDHYVIWLLLLTAAFGAYLIWERKRKAPDSRERR